MFHHLRATVAGLCLLAAASPAGADEHESVLREIKVSGGGAAPVVEIIADAPLTFTSYTMPQLLHAVIDLPNAAPGPVRETIPVRSGMINKISVVQKRVNDVPLTRVVIHTQREATLSVAADPATPGRLIAFLSPAPPAATYPAATAPATPPAGHTPQTPTAPAPTPSPATPSAPSRPTAAVPPPPPATPSPRPAPAVSRAGQRPELQRITLVDGGIEVFAGAPLSGYRAFVLKEPHRLVIDIPDARTADRAFPLPANPWGITGARTGLYADKLRLVFDSGTRPLPPWEVCSTATGLRVTFPQAGAKGSTASKPGR